MSIKVTVEVDSYDARIIAKQFGINVQKATKLFAQNLVDRYFSVEYLDTDDCIWSEVKTNLKKGEPK